MSKLGRRSPDKRNATARSNVNATCSGHCHGTQASDGFYRKREREPGKEDGEE
jgi:hypothetical protein